MKIEDLKKKRCFIFPFSNMSEILKKTLELNNIEFLGYIDNQKTGKEILTFNESLKVNFDLILIYSPNHCQKIYEQCIEKIDNKSIKNVRYDSIKKLYFFDDFHQITQNNNLLEYFNFKKNIAEDFANSVLLIGIGFIDLNVKYLYLYLKNFTDIDVFLATDNIRDINIFKESDIDVIDVNSKDFIDLVFKCKIKIVDHNPVNELMIESLKVGKSIQLWHGITIETLGVLTNYKVVKYDVVLSTSDFVSDYSFSKIYDYKKLVNFGYPRNDVLYNHDLPLMNIDIKLYDDVIDKKHKYIVYMPTHRPLGFEKNPIDYEKLNNFAFENDYKIIIKMHPFVAEKLRDDLSFYQKQNVELSNLIIYESYMDIYPILKYVDILISDYSSVYFDFLYVNKPIIFFCYDYEKWVEGEQGIILDYFEYSPGDKCYSFEELLVLIKKNIEKDNYKIEREKIFKKMFTNQNKKASYLLSKEIMELLND